MEPPLVVGLAEKMRLTDVKSMHRPSNGVNMVNVTPLRPSKLLHFVNDGIVEFRDGHHVHGFLNSLTADLTVNREP